MPIVYEKYVFLKKTRCSQAHILSEKRAFSQKIYSHVIFSQIFHEKLSAVKPLFCQSILSKLHYILGPKSQ